MTLPLRTGAAVRRRLASAAEALEAGNLMRCSDLAAAIGVSERTLYRYIGRLRAKGLPIRGERGVGYVLRRPGR